MEAAIPLPFSQVRTQGARLWIDGLVVDDACAVRLAREREQAGEDVARLVADAIAIGARVLDREQTGANADFVKAEFEKAARELDAAFVERARLVAERLDARIDDVFGPENGHLTKAMARHFGDESSVAVQNRVKALLGEVTVQMREDLRRQFSSDGENNPLATFQRMAIGAMRDSAQAQTTQLKAMDEKLAGLREEVVKLQADKEKLEEVAAEVQRGTAKGRSYEEEVAAAIDALALPLGDDCEAVGDLKEATGKKGDVVVSIGAGHGPSQGRVVFEAKNSRLSRPEAIRQLEDARSERNADYAVLVVPSEDKVPARMHALREYNGDKLVVAYDVEEGALALQVAYSLARARVLMARGGSDGVDGVAVFDTVERAVGALEEVRRVRQQLTGAKTQIDKASEIVGAMSDRVRAHLEEIAELMRAADEGADATAQDGGYATARDDAEGP
jgi:predicted metal-dependent hydrolase